MGTGPGVVPSFVPVIAERRAPAGALATHVALAQQCVSSCPWAVGLLESMAARDSAALPVPPEHMMLPCSRASEQPGLPEQSWEASALLSDTRCDDSQCAPPPCRGPAVGGLGPFLPRAL